MDAVARNSLQAVNGVLESVVDTIDKAGIGNLDSETEGLERFARRLPGMGTIYITDDAGKLSTGQ